ncbi:uncharacterized protein N7459_003439 [Penicillium hispanicum]|uniref:uncharacterized protein n=1 Tax=Penicillium hispanicum TaxID=1080232 RepID=UPI00254208F5|nr:uncharacterized protein N7459_003439 [Penicillium hispanicum]KAJ5587674.1 hypothetical protein N7459_003439 [Penicillium hispanicum]
MWKPSIPTYLVSEHLPLRTGRYLSCQFRNAVPLSHLHANPSSLRFYASQNKGGEPGSATSNGAPTITSRLPSKEQAAPLQRQVQFQSNTAGEQSSEQSEEPPELIRPIGTMYAPEEGQNTGIDTRSIRQRRDDFVDYDKHLARRKELTRQVAKPYFRDWSNLRHHKGKVFRSNPRLFRADKALYFPNMHGITLASPKDAQDTTTALRGKISIVNLFSSVWAEEQYKSFTSAEHNPGLAEVLTNNGDYAQNVYINLEENRLKAWLVKKFMAKPRSLIPEHEHTRYFLVEKGLTDELKESICVMNNFVGYVYLLDAECRIRWAGSGPAEPSEIEILNAGVQKLIAEQKALESETRARR